MGQVQGIASVSVAIGDVRVVQLSDTHLCADQGGKLLGTCRGRDQIRKRFRTPTLRFAWHYFVKPKIEVEGETARASWDVLAPCTTLDGKAHWMAGAEDDEYRKLGGVWLHSRMQLRVVFMAPYEKGWTRD